MCNDRNNDLAKQRQEWIEKDKELRKDIDVQWRSINERVDAAIAKEKERLKQDVNKVVPDFVHTLLDGAGLIPGFGEIFDGINAGIYYAEGDYVNGGLSVVATIPFWGWGGTGAKWGKKVIHAVDDGVHFAGGVGGKVVVKEVVKEIPWSSLAVQSKAKELRRLMDSGATLRR